MEQELLHALLIFFAGLVLGMVLMLLVNKLRSGSVSPGKVKQEFDDYQAQVESHFEETSQKFKDMTQQYQDLYKHLSVGATSLCRPDSVAATGLANQSDAVAPAKLEQKAAAVKADHSESLKSGNSIDTGTKPTEPTRTSTAAKPNSDLDKTIKAKSNQSAVKKSTVSSPPKPDTKSAVNRAQEAAKTDPAAKSQKSKPQKDKLK